MRRPHRTLAPPKAASTARTSEMQVVTADASSPTNRDVDKPARVRSSMSLPI